MLATLPPDQPWQLMAWIVKEGARQCKIEDICFTTADFGIQAVINIHCVLCTSDCGHAHPVLIRVIQYLNALSCYDLPCVCLCKDCMLEATDVGELLL